MVTLPPKEDLRAARNWGPITVPSVGVSVVPRAKMTVTVEHALASISPVGAAMAERGRRRRDKSC